MGTETKIEWCDHTFNPWYGCSKVSLACDDCYAEVWAKRSGLVVWYGPRRRSKDWTGPDKWNAAAKAAGRKETVFCLSLGDIWDNEVPTEWRADLFEVIERTPNLIWLLLSKRIGNAEKMYREIHGDLPLPPNVALGATMINQMEWDRDCHKLTRAGENLRALFTFASVEPMLGPIAITGEIPDWVICGGETGHHARHMEEAWAENLMHQAVRRNATFFMKQMTGKKPIPERLMVRQFPRFA